ncbi:cytochrome C assembly family protein, partial [Vibrio parahaemolyticus AQ3810]
CFSWYVVAIGSQAAWFGLGFYRCPILRYAICMAHDAVCLLARYRSSYPLEA